MAEFDYPLGTAGTLVNERFNQAEDIGEGAFQTSMQVIQSLQVIVQQLALIDRTISIDTTTISPTEISVDAPTIDHNEFRIDMPDLPVEPTLTDAQVGTLPEFPDLVVGDLAIPDETYATSLFTAIKSKLLSDIIDGSTGLTPSIEDAIFQREYERALLIHNDTQDRIAATWARNGYPLPSGALLGAYEEEEINFTNKRLDISRDVAIKSFELALNNYHFIIQQGIALESQLMNYAHEVAKLAFQAADEVIKNAIAAFRERREKISAERMSILEKSKTLIQYNVSLIEMFTAKLGAYSAKIRGEADRVTATAEADTAEVNLFTSIANFDIAKTGLDLKVVEARINQAVANSNILIKDKEIEMKNYEVFNSLKIEVMKAIGQVCAQIVAGAYAGVSAAAHISRQDSSSYEHKYEDKKIFLTSEDEGITVP